MFTLNKMPEMFVIFVISNALLMIKATLKARVEDHFSWERILIYVLACLCEYSHRALESTYSHRSRLVLLNMVWLSSNFSYTYKKKCFPRSIKFANFFNLVQDTNDRLFQRYKWLFTTKSLNFLAETN